MAGTDHGRPTGMVAEDFVGDHEDQSRARTFSIGDLAREFDVTLRTLRFYEDKGLLAPRRDGSNRIYTRRDRARLKLILMGKRVGFSLTDIKKMVDLYDLRDGQVSHLAYALEKFNEQIATLERQRRDIDQALGELKRTVSVVAGLLREKQSNPDG